jgi:hypothetical protein
MEILKIMEDFDEYLLEYKQNNAKMEIKISSLSFTLCNANEIHVFQCLTPVVFMKWLTVIQMRKEIYAQKVD